MADTGMDSLDAGLGLFPVVAELQLAAQRPLRAPQSGLVPPEAVQRREETAIAEGGESGNTHIDADGAGGLRHRRLNLALGLDAHIPLARPQGYGGIAWRAQHRARQAQPYPAKFRKKEAAIDLIEFELLGVGIAETVALAAFFELRKPRALSKEVLVGSLQVLQRLLQRVRRRIPEPRCLRTVAPLGEQLAQPCIAHFPLAALIARFLQRQRLVVDESAGTGEAAHVAFLRPVGLQLALESLHALHEPIIPLVHGNWKPTSAREPLRLSDERALGVRETGVVSSRRRFCTTCAASSPVWVQT